MSSSERKVSEVEAGMVSVVLIFLNEERFLQEAITSVEGQSMAEWELLLVDDGSTDTSGEIARRAAARDPVRIRYLTHEGRGNRGKSESRNVGLHAARGKYIAFLDGDDVFRPEKLERQAAILDANPGAAMVYGPTLYWWQWPGSPPSGNIDAVREIGVAPDRIHSPPSLLEAFFKDGNIIPCICGLTVLRKVALEVNGFDLSVNYLFEDQVFLAKICLQYPVFVESGCRDQYRQHADSTSSRAIAAGVYHPSKANPAERAYLDWLHDYVRETKRGTPELKRLIRRARFRYDHPRLSHALALVHRAKRRVFGRTRMKAVST